MDKQIAQYTFSYVCTISLATDSAGAVTEVAPQASFTKRTDLSLHAYGGGPFCRFRISNHLRHKWVYTLNLGAEVLYVGECQNLAARYNMGYGQISPRNCFQGGQPTNCRINNLIYQAAAEGRQTELWFLETDNRKAIEVELIRKLQPIWNRKSLLFSTP